MIHEGVLCVNVFTHIDADVCVIFHLQKIVSRTVNTRHTFPHLRPRATTAPILPQYELAQAGMSVCIPYGVGVSVGVRVVKTPSKLLPATRTPLLRNPTTEF